MSQSVAQVKEILIHSALKVEIEVKQSGVRFQLWHSLPAPSVLLVHTGLYSRSVLKQMTPGFPTIDHNKKNTPTAYCSHLLLERHLSLLPSFSYNPISLAVCFSTLHKHSYPGLFLQVVLLCFCLVCRLPSLCSCTVTGARMCFSAFSTTESSLCQRVKWGGRGGLSGWAHSEGAKWKDGGRRGEPSGRSHWVARV